MPATPCPNGCADPCVDWHDWERCGDCHAPFHHWRWNGHNDRLSKQRLGERVYVSACLLWTALHDRRLGQRLLSQNPNWSAVCNYYSMVHSLRLFWFILYGSYPKGHAQLAHGLQNGRGASANWTLDMLSEAEKHLGASVFQSLLQDELVAPAVALQVPLFGAMFESARLLRNDSNYESLILAHQYFHGRVEVSVPDEMNKASTAMSEASKQVLRYMGRLISTVFRNDRPWIGNGSPYTGTDLLTLLCCYVKDKIRGATDDQQPASAVQAEWFEGLPEIAQYMTDAEIQGTNSAHELVACIKYTVFGGKRSLMMSFQQKVTRLKNCVERLVAGDVSQSVLID